MREPLFTPANRAPQLLEVGGDPNSVQDAREAAALHHATALALESAFTHGIDMPVGAVALRGAEIVGRGFASDRRLGQPILHAEVMSLFDTKFDVAGAVSGTVVTTLEPCTQCQDYLATQPGLTRVAFGLSRADAASRGLVNHHDETIFERATRVSLPYEVVQVDDAHLRAVGLTILDNIWRDTGTGAIRVDTASLSLALADY
ncbi:MAG: hypothetical protein JWM81_112 [Candidatus Saccharibacteria bacterium]|nr:hypothetical protein [Candidatus Saccharibacteria bacterium]